MKLARGSGIVAIALVALTARPASARDAALAETLFREGKSMMQSGDYEHGCPKLRESYDQDAATGTLLALALCYEQQGKLATAWSTYTEVAARAHQEARTDREQTARDRVAAIEARFSKLTIRVPPSVAALADLVIKRDGLPSGEAAWGTAVPVDGGVHLVEVSARGKQPWRQEVTILAERDARVVTVPELEAAPLVDEPTGAASANPRPEPNPSDGAARQASALRPVGIVVGAVGIVAIGAGAVFGLSAHSADEDSRADGHCDATGCDATGKERRNDAFSKARLSTVSFIVGGVLATGGVVLFVLGSRQHDGRGSIGVTPVAGRDGAGLWLRGDF
jgi:hypothetical protein